MRERWRICDDAHIIVLVIKRPHHDIMKEITV